MMTGATERQLAILNFIVSHISDHGFPPTRADICRAFGFKSTNSAECHLIALERRGFISVGHGKARSIRVLKTSPVLQAISLRNTA